MGWTVRIALGLVLATLSVGKFSTPYRPTLVIPAWGYFSAACLEAVLAVAVLTRFVRVAAWLAVAFFGSAVVLAVFVAGDCGCLAGLADGDRRARFIVAGLGGLLASLVLQVLGPTGVPVAPTSDGNKTPKQVQGTSRKSEPST